MEGVATLAALAALGVAVVAIVLALRAERRGGQLTPSAARVIDLERRLTQTAQRLELLEKDVDAQRSDTPGEARPVANAIRRTGSAISHVGLARFDAFEDTGGGQSFALALIDDEGDGVILTSLHSRQTTRVFIKDIRGGVADAPLSGEEERALREAGLVT
jgi:Protein of unknown function (DUF4446)